MNCDTKNKVAPLLEEVVKELDNRYGLPNRVPFLCIQVAQNLEGRSCENFLSSVERFVYDYIYNEKIELKNTSLKDVGEFFLAEKVTLFRPLLDSFTQSVVHMFEYLVRTPAASVSKERKIDVVFISSLVVLLYKGFQTCLITVQILILLKPNTIQF
jgi:hypothetical protein